jgi:type VI protein secretion system component VasK
MATNPPPATPKPAPPDTSSKKVTALPLYASIVAGLLLLAYFVFAALQWANVDAAALTYARRAQLLGGFEALAFAAAGAILGTTVQREVTKKAENEADAQKKRADAEQLDAEKGRALHNLARAKAADRGLSRVRGGDEPAPAGDAGEFLELAEQYDAAP